MLCICAGGWEQLSTSDSLTERAQRTRDSGKLVIHSRILVTVVHVIVVNWRMIVASENTLQSCSCYLLNWEQLSTSRSRVRVPDRMQSLITMQCKSNNQKTAKNAVISQSRKLHFIEAHFIAWYCDIQVQSAVYLCAVFSAVQCSVVLFEVQCAVCRMQCRAPCSVQCAAWVLGGAI